MQLPGHAESYNPPPEYLFTKEEVGMMNVLSDQKLNNGKYFDIAVICCTNFFYEHISFKVILVFCKCIRHCG